MKEIRILGLRVNDRIKEAGRTQSVLSAYAESINTRLGFHEVSEDVCSRTGFIILELRGDPKTWDKLEIELDRIGGLDVKNMSFGMD
ncbi:MAG: hypothetical protein U9R19_09915 [Bacteroidota bacterium]|nr:hypothetical protein [Bacteroidota bacterium]